MRTLPFIRRTGALLAAGVALSQGLAHAAEPAPESAQLAALVRQLQALERLSEHTAEAVATQAPARYHFDYARLQADLERVRAGIEAYLNPLRAQPRDPQALSGDYTREGTLEP